MTLAAERDGAGQSCVCMLDSAWPFISANLRPFSLRLRRSRGGPATPRLCAVGGHATRQHRAFFNVNGGSFAAAAD